MKRIQRKRTKGWKMPDNAVYVGRPSKWGNPFCAEDYSAHGAVERYRECILNNSMSYAYLDEPVAGEWFDRFKWIAENLKRLEGKDLACWCPLSSPCHADVLIELVKGGNQ